MYIEVGDKFKWLVVPALIVKGERVILGER